MAAGKTDVLFWRIFYDVNWQQMALLINVLVTSPFTSTLTNDTKSNLSIQVSAPV